MADAVNEAQLRLTLDQLLVAGPRSEARLLIEVTRQFNTCDMDSLEHAVTFLLSSRFVASGAVWRKPRTASEADEALQQWLRDSGRRRHRLLHQVQHGRPVDSLNQYEIAEWIEGAAKAQDDAAVRQLFPLLRRDSFSDERWFELERCFSDVQRASAELAVDLERLEAEARELRAKLQLLEREILAKNTSLARLGEGKISRPARGFKASRSYEPGTRTRGRRRFTHIVVRAGGQEGKINQLLFRLGVLTGDDHQVDSNRGMKLLLRAGYQVEVVKGNEMTPAGAVFAKLEDLG